ncbi:TOM40 mitochondrial import outer membrane translocon protein [Klebsormidium nitens]|uniref:TOM40 mitochondrial import outer membrane translocon protein n=1 Tax=Klebsormidium nitens TaxID=105231 RepID=A0A1Y1IE27_KLENI|nr:TOM40 mitochondrial import outer membrane translocon protein [Klebsormidium nitens]|eukprot:GAQ87361.1 TOM40 mitochondrial import outer membrane translocon protein [Klebsormidium nitens]
MGASISHADANVTTPLPPPLGTVPEKGAAGPPVGLQQLVEPPKEIERTDYLNLPTPVKYEEIQKEALYSLKPELFEGCRFDFTRPLSPKFALTHGILMGPMEVPQQTPQIVKVVHSQYEFGANYVWDRGMLVGRMLNTGAMNARAVIALSEDWTFKMNSQLSPEPHSSIAMFDFDKRGPDYQAQIKLGNNAFYSFNYLQSVTKTLSLGGEIFWLGKQRKSGYGLALRHQEGKGVFSAQVASTGMAALTYSHKLSDKVNLASDLSYNWKNGEAVSSVGYDYNLRSCRLRGKLDTNGVVGALLEERLNVGVNLLLSAEVDHWRKDYKFGFGMTVGE